MPVFGSPTQYATATDLANLSLIGGVLSSTPLAIQNATLLAASGVADAALQSRYNLPLTQWGQDLVRAVCIIAAYDILTSKGLNPSSTDNNIRERYLDALAWLKSIGNEEATPSYIIDSSVGTVGATTAVDTSDGSIVTTTPGGFQLVTSPVRGWTRRGGTSVPDTDWDVD